MQEKNQPYAQILDFLIGLVDSATSGTLFIHTECNRAVTIALDNGEIHALYMGARRGRKAIPLISNITGGSYRFEVSNLIDAVHDLPPTHEILHLLRRPQSSDTAVVSERSVPTNTHAIPTPISNHELLSNEKKDVLCHELKELLSEHLGPIAEVVFDDAVEEVGDFRSSPELIHDLINKLSEEIDSTNEVQHFITNANVILNSILMS